MGLGNIAKEECAYGQSKVICIVRLLCRLMRWGSTPYKDGTNNMKYICDLLFEIEKG